MASLDSNIFNQVCALFSFCDLSYLNYYYRECYKVDFVIFIT